ncbi:ABC transporter substrate-binding protein [Pseudonocardiaceae bacterium YIM PH 21723]|nr:ABC transporter substrate-binding protein [Pseudonocardiaceae bacterium YIM PH 21723]
MRRAKALALVVPLIVTLGACSRAAETTDAAPKGEGPASEVRLGFFPNITHAAALIGVEQGTYKKYLGEKTKLTTQTFNAGPAEVEALLGNSLDVGYMGPGPAINAFTNSKGAIRIYGGAASAGAQLVVKPEINSAADLKGKTIAAPQLGGTQDIALRAWLKDKGYKTDHNGGNDVKIQDQDNGVTLDSFKKGGLDGAWLPEPWASRLVLEAGAKVLLDEKSLWPDGKFPTTVIVARKDFADKHPETLAAILKANIEAVQLSKGTNSADAKNSANKQLATLSGKGLSDAVLQRAWSNLELSNDPLAKQFAKQAKDSVKAGTLTSEPDLTGIFQLDALNRALKEQGLDQTVSSDTGGK